MQQTSPQAYLIIQLGNRWTDVLRLQPHQSITVGRSSDNQIVVRDERVSRRHAQISPQGGVWEVRDLGSRNGTQVDELTLDGPHRLSEGETIGVGGCRMTFSHSLSGGFAATRSLSGAGHAESLGGQQTVELTAPPTIVNRRAHSQWSSADLAPLPSSAQSNESLSKKWNYFYRLIFELVACESPEQAASVALERLLDQLGIASGGVMSLEFPAATTATAKPPAATAQVTPTPARTAAAGSSLDGSSPASRSSAGEPPPMTVLAARQPEGSSYQRVSDFLVTAVVKDRQAVLARNVMDDSKLSLASQTARRDVVSIVCAPLRVREHDREHIVGLLHVYSSGDERMLTEADLDLTVGVADNLAIALARLETRERLSKSLEHSRRAVHQLQEQLELTSEMVGQSAALQQVRRAIQRAAPTAATVLIRGESGVGKELVARAIHNASERKDGPLVCLNCAALAPTLLESELFGHEKGAFTGATERKIGKFEAADGGTLLLDEIGEMHSDLQAKFLRVLEGQPFERLGGHKPITTHVRVIAATNRNLEEAVQAKEFRADLYYRLRVVEISVPPLRERLEDIPQLVERFIEQLRHHATRRIHGIEATALQALARHRWPGNVRELRNVIERAIVLGGHPSLQIDDLSLSSLGEATTQSDTTQSDTTSDSHQLAAADFAPLSLAEIEKAHILATLEHVSGNKSKASQLLGIERSTLDRKLKRYEA